MVELLKMDLQIFAEGDGTPTPEDNVPDFDTLFDVDPSVQLDEYGDPIPNQQPPQTPEPPTPAPAPAPEPQATPPAPAQPQEPQKPVQSPEDNARFAEQRRQQQIEERARQLADQQLAQRPEGQLAKLLEQQYGMPVDQLVPQLQQAMLQQQSQATGIPVEFLQQQQQMQQQLQQIEQRAQQAEFNNWYSQKNAEKAAVMQEYPFLGEDKVNAAMVALLDTIGNKDLPLSQAVMFLHGPEIMQNIQQQAHQTALAEVSGREPGALPPQGNRPSQDAPMLTPEERQMAKLMGISEADYLANKDSV